MARLSRTTGIALAASAAIVLLLWFGSRSLNIGERRMRQTLLEELQPVALENCRLGRFGGPNDTGFLMCKNLLDEAEAVYSYGLIGNDDWACDVSQRYQMPVHQYNCADPPRPLCPNGDLVFHNECLGGRREQVDSRSFDTL